ncbi:phosphatidate cytidylyltransferase [Collimonas pratensis]|uniref:Cytidylyltransferase family protein n=1 Tax=Collimonas pratensis TaxID=279113 RepID=A0ABM5Z6B9_9BURK|nr:phosphatidate cytidylyltransferase [Collimonas pratensis]AMP14540.1 cytidylyltransferase family protein [Collimonas pratensis]
MLSSLVAGSSTVSAMLVLYLMLAMASLGAAFKTRAVAHSQLRLQINAWWLIFPLVSLSLLLYPAGPALLALLICILALRELTQHYRGSRRLFLFRCTVTLALAAALSWQQPYFAMLLLPWMMLAQFAYFLWRRQTDQLLLLLFFSTCCGLSFIVQLMHLSLAEETRIAWLFYLFAMTALNDIGQFIAGKTLGKHTIAARISPNKTWQGLFGGVLASMLASVLLGSYLQLASLPQLLLLALLMSLGGFTGDMLFSAAKRFLGIKDFSSLIPGHGGILDRVDSLVVTAPLLYFALYFSHQG